MLLAAFFLNQLLFCCLTLFLKLYTQSLPFSYTTHRKSVTCQTIHQPFTFILMVPLEHNSIALLIFVVSSPCAMHCSVVLN